MKLSKKQRDELQVIRYYIPDGEWKMTTDEDVEQFFALSDRGVKPIILDPWGGLASLLMGKQMRDFVVSGYRFNWGKYWFPTDFLDSPEYIVEYLSKALQKPEILTLWRNRHAS